MSVCGYEIFESGVLEINRVSGEVWAAWCEVTP